MVVVDSEDYPEILEFLKGNQDDQQFRRKLAWKAFGHVAAYDSAVSEWLWKQTSGGSILCLCVSFSNFYYLGNQKQLYVILFMRHKSAICNESISIITK